MVREGRFATTFTTESTSCDLKVPALRERPEDVLWLAYKFLEEQGTRLRETPRLLSLGAQSALLAHAWPGNIRELRNKIERACVLSAPLSQPRTGSRKETEAPTEHQLLCPRSMHSSPMPNEPTSERSYVDSTAVLVRRPRPLRSLGARRCGKK